MVDQTDKETFFLKINKKESNIQESIDKKYQERLQSIMNKRSELQNKVEAFKQQEIAKNDAKKEETLKKLTTELEKVDSEWNSYFSHLEEKGRTNQKEAIDHILKKVLSG